MKKAFVIAEKPSLLRSILSAYKNHASEFDFELEGIAQAGHLFGLKYPGEMDESMKKWEMENYPWFPDKYEYKITDDKSYKRTKSQIFQEIKKAIHSGKYDFIIHAGDSDQEGEILIRETLIEAKNTLPVMRFWVNATTEEEYVHGLKELEPDDKPFYENMYQAALARQHSDYLIGMNLSPVVSLKANETAHIGRLKTFINALIVKRELEIMQWKPSSTYVAVAQYKEGFTGTYPEPFATEKEALAFTKELSNQAVVRAHETKRTKKYAPNLFKLSTLQIAASKKGYSAENVQDICQSLYEKGYLSYPRTSCEYVNDSANFTGMLKSAKAFPELVPFIDGIDSAAIERVKKNKNYVRNEEVADAGHMALTPTTQSPNLSKLSTEEKDILYMVYAQYVAIFLPPLVQDKTKIVTVNNGYEFITNGKVLIDEGFTKLLTMKLEDTPLPVIKEGATVHVKEFNTVEKKATPPKRYTDGTLIEALEQPAKYLEDSSLRGLGKVIDISIGRPSTRAPILKELIALGYLTHEKKNLKPTEKGFRYAYNIQTSSLCKADTTALWEEKLEKIRKGTMKREDFESQIRDYIVGEISQLKTVKMKQAKKEGVDVIGTCPKCGADFITGQYGSYCQGKCGFVLKQFRGKKLTEAQKKKILKGQPVDLKNLTAKSGKSYNMRIKPTEKFSSFEHEGKTYYSMDFETEFID